MIERGILHLGHAAVGDELSEYHIQAAIAACHCLAEDYQSTDWLKILSLYDQWTQINKSPVIALNRAVAIAKVNGPRAGIEAVEAIQDRGELDSYYLLYAVRGEFESQLRHFEAAAGYFRKALHLTEVKSEQKFLSKKVRALRSKEPGIAG